MESPKPRRARSALQERLMASTDRDIALSLAGIADKDEATVLAHLAPRKADLLIASLLGERAVAGSRSYVRPRRRDR